MNRITQLQVGESLEAIRLEPVNRLNLIKYAGASGDFNPIHTIDQEASTAGLPGIIAHGMWTMGNLAKLFTPYMEEGFVQDYSIRFRRMVFLGDQITLKAILREKSSDQMSFKVMAVNQKEEEVINGNIVFSIYDLNESA